MAIINSVQSAIQWFKINFESEIKEALEGTPFTSELACAIAYQETGYIWTQLVNKGLSINEVLELCVGDTLDYPKRKAFPQTHTALKAYNPRLFLIAREAVAKMAKHIKGYSIVNSNPNKFAHGFGIFQYDIQFCKENPSFFLEKKWANKNECFKALRNELIAAAARMGWKNKKTYTHNELVYLAIAYNRGRADLSKGFAQGHKNSEGVYYGQNIDKYLKY